MTKFTQEIRAGFKFLDYAPIIYISAKDRVRINDVFQNLDLVYDSYCLRVQTSTLNEIMQDAQIMNPTPYFNGGRLKIFFANQVSTKPPTFVLFVNDTHYMHFSYQRFIENRLRATFGFEGTPINVVCRERK